MLLERLEPSAPGRAYALECSGTAAGPLPSAPAEDEPPPQPVTPAAMEIARVTAAAALMVRLRDRPFPGRKAVFENRTAFRA